MDNQKPELDEDNTYAKEALLCEIGTKLQEGRRAKGLSSEQVVKELKFSPLFLQALESGDWSEMPGEIYGLGFLRQYAELLEIDVHDDINRIKTNSYELTTPLTYPDAPISPNRTWVVIAALLFIFIMLVMNLFDQGANDKVVEDSVSPSTAPSQEVVPVQEERKQQDLMTKEEPKSAAPMISPGDKSDAVMVSQNVKHVSQSETKKINIESQASNFEALGLKTYTFYAVTDDVWMQVFEDVEDASEPWLLREALLKMGEKFTIQSSSPLLLTSGKPTALEVSIDGDVLYEQGTLGEEDKVLKMFPL